MVLMEQNQFDKHASRRAGLMTCLFHMTLLGSYSFLQKQIIKYTWYESGTETKAKPSRRGGGGEGHSPEPSTGEQVPVRWTFVSSSVNKQRHSVAAGNFMLLSQLLLEASCGGLSRFWGPHGEHGAEEKTTELENRAIGERPTPNRLKLTAVPPRVLRGVSEASS